MIKTFSTLLLCSILLVSCSATKLPRDHYIENREIFNQLVEQWEEENSYNLSSWPKDYWVKPSGKKIINLGLPALPFIISEIEKGNHYFNVAAEKTTNISLKDSKAINNDQANSKLWLKWWSKNKNNPKWNVYLRSDI